MTTISYQAELFQLNTSEDGVGEGAIAILIEYDSSISPNSGTIKSPVLIDSGLAGRSRKRLEETIAKIEARFMPQTGIDPKGKPIYQKLQFDAMTISHWDKVSLPCRELDQKN
jgi:hypothetical protein